MDLRVGVKISDTLDVHHDQLVSRPLEAEVAEGLMKTKENKMLPKSKHDLRSKGGVTHLWSESDVVVPDKA